MTTKWSFFAYGKDILPDFSPMEGEKRAAPGRPLPKILFAVKDAGHQRLARSRQGPHVHNAQRPQTRVMSAPRATRATVAQPQPLTIPFTLAQVFSISRCR